MNPHHIQAALMAVIAVFIGWQLVQTLRTGHVTIHVEGVSATRADKPRTYWVWTTILAVLEVVALAVLVSALRAR